MNPRNVTVDPFGAVTSTTVVAFAVGGVTVMVDGPWIVIDLGTMSGPVVASRYTTGGSVTVPPVGHASMSACTSVSVAVMERSCLGR